MTHKNILVIAIRVAAIFLTIHVIESFPQQFGSYLQLSNEYATTSYLVTTIIAPSLISLIFAIVFWFFPNMLIKAIVPDAAKNNDDPEYFNSLNSALISAIGVYMLAFGSADLVYYYSLKREMVSQFGEGSVLSPENYAYMISTIIEVFMGLSLILGNKAITAYIARVRK